MTTLSLDFESYSEAPLTGANSCGLHNYMRHPSTEATMLAFDFNDEGRVQQVDFTNGERLPPEVRDALLDPHVEKWAYNATFERLATKLLLKIDTPIQGWRCTQALAYMRSFSGGLGDVGGQLEIEGSHLKDKRGKALIQKFAVPQVRRSKGMQIYSRCTRETDPEDWQTFLDYNRRDVLAETAIKRELLRYPLLEEEWELYEIDQAINDRGLPIDLQFVSNAARMAQRRRAELTLLLEKATWLDNPNSQAQLLPWLKRQNYPYDDLQKATITKVLLQHKNEPVLTEICVAALNLRQQANRTSVAKYAAIGQRISPDNTIKHCFQFAGASRTNRWAGRSVQPQNLGRTPKFLDGKVELASELIRQDDYHAIKDQLNGEVMAVLAGSVRSSIKAKEGYRLVVCDLSAIESAVIAWLSGCKRMLSVFTNGIKEHDPYTDFGQELYGKPYSEITKAERTISKPAVLGCGFGLGGGMLRDGKRTGLWGYAEAMGIEVEQEEAARQVKLFRDTYPEIVKFWQDLDDGCRTALRGKVAHVGRIMMEMRGKFMTFKLPSGRLMFYRKPFFQDKEFENKDGEKYTRSCFTYEGIIQGTKQWGRVVSGGPKLCIAGDTLVLTSSGWKQLEEVASDDLLWDGEEWVGHSGVVFNGVKEVISVDGVLMTEDHQVLTEDGWAYAKDCDDRARYATALPDSGSADTAIQERKDVLGNTMRLWGIAVYESGSLSARRRLFVRVQEAGIDSEGTYETRDVSTSSVSRLAVHDSSLHASDASVVEELRGSRNYGMRSVGAIVRELLDRHGIDISTGFGDRAGRQQQRVFTGKLRVDYSYGELQQQKNERFSGHSVGADDVSAGIAEIRHWGDDAAVSTKTKMQPVYDILNAGHNNRFVVAGETGPFIVHNCENVTQAVARDVLAAGMRNAHHYGFRLVGSVHDELIAMQKQGSNRYNLEALRQCMTENIPWATGLPLDAAGYESVIYKKD